MQQNMRTSIYICYKTIYESEATKMKDRRTQMDYDKIVIYPCDYDGGTRQKLYEKLRELGVRFDYEQYA